MSKIQWTEKTWNPLSGCKEISPGCTNCYAATMAHRLTAMGQEKYVGTTRKLPNGKVVWTGKINLDPDALQIPLQRKTPTMYFVNSMSDLFHEDVPDAFIDQVFAVMAFCPQHTFQVLTKRASRLPEWFAGINNRRRGYWCEHAGYLHDVAVKTGILSDDAADTIHAAANRHWNHNSPKPSTSLGDSSVSIPWPLPNVWLGVSVEDQQRADERIPFLLQTPAAVRWLSCEPLLGCVDLSSFLGVNHATQECRRASVPSGFDGGIGDRQRRKNLESSGSTVESLEELHGVNSVPSAKSGEGFRGVSADQGDDWPKAGRSSGSQIGMEARQPAPDTGGVDSEPQGRKSEKQSSRQSGTGNIRRTDGTSNQGDWSRSKEESCAISWVIVGGESGHGARPMHPNWARSLRDQCQAAGVPFFFKQWGEFAPLSNHHVKVPSGNYAFTPSGEKVTVHDKRELRIWPATEIDDDDCFSAVRVGKEAAGRLLDGREWNEYPTTKASVTT